MGDSIPTRVNILTTNLHEFTLIFSPFVKIREN